MLLQSHLGDVQLLPALPSAWSEGHVKGLIAKGDFEIELFWKEGKLIRALVKSVKDGQCKLRTNNKISLKGIGAQTAVLKSGLATQYPTAFNATAGKIYELNTQ